MSNFPHYQDSPESRAFPVPVQSLGSGLSQRVRELTSRLPLAAVFGLRTAAWLHGLDVLPRSVSDECWPVEVIVPPHVNLPSRRGLRVYRWGLRTDVEQRDGALVTTRARTALDCARVLPRLDAVAAVDKFLRHGVTLPLLRRHAGRVTARRDHPAMQSILDVADPRSESPLESWCRCLIADSGLPRPQAQLPVTVRDGSVAHLDLGYREFKLGVECNGRRYHGTDAARHRDERRRELLDGEGWSVITVHGSDVLVFPDDMLADLRTRLRNRGWNPSGGYLARVAKPIDYIAMCLRLDREDWSAAWGLS